MTSLVDELAVYELLLEDLRAASLTEDADKKQLQEVLNATSLRTYFVDEKSDSVDHHLSDLSMAFGLSEREIEMARDQAYAQVLQNEDAGQDAAITLSRQYALRLSAAETKIRMDSEFAAKLQAMIDDGDDSDASHDSYDADRWITTNF